MSLWRNKQTYPLIITKCPPYLFHWNFFQFAGRRKMPKIPTTKPIAVSLLQKLPAYGPILSPDLDVVVILPADVADCVSLVVFFWRADDSVVAKVDFVVNMVVDIRVWFCLNKLKEKTFLCLIIYVFNNVLKSHFGIQHHITYMYIYRHYKNTLNHFVQNYKRLYKQDLYEQNMASKKVH